MPSSVEYTVIRDGNLDTLIDMVNQAIAEGWQPLGGLVADSRLWCQAMTRSRRPS